MSPGAHTGQLIGGCVEYAGWFIAGAYFAWVRPGRLQKQVEEGKISAEQKQTSLRKFSPFLGYLVMIAAVAFGLSQFF